MSVLITGSSGYIGSYLVNYLKENHVNVVTYDIDDGQSILDYKQLLHSLDNVIVVIHLAALSSVPACTKNPDSAEIINVKGTATLLKAMNKMGCKNIIYASTSAVYGDSNNLPFTEKHDTNPCSVYGKTKLDCEYRILESGLNYIIFRMFNIVGKNPLLKHEPCDRLFKALESDHVTIYGNTYNTKDGTCERDYVSLDDTCNAYYLALKYMMFNSSRLILNLSSNVSVSVQTIVDLWKPKTVQYGTKREGDPDIVIGDNTQITKKLGWLCKDTMKNIIESYK